MKRTLIVLLLAALAAGAWSNPPFGVPCGTWVEISATPYKGYRFAGWSDGVEDSVRLIQVSEDVNLTAYFADICADRMNWPVVALYDWLLMLDVKSINAEGYYVKEDAVRWYRVVSTPDNLHDPFPQDDEEVCTGYYLTLGRNLQHTGDYYAVASVASEQAVCGGLMRSVVVHFQSTQNQPRLMLAQSTVGRGGQVQVDGLVPEEVTILRLYNTQGQLISTQTVQGHESATIVAPWVDGMYLLHAASPTQQNALKLIVK